MRRPGDGHEAGLRSNVDVGIRYLAAWLRGNGAVGIHNLMEDAATAEIPGPRSGSGSHNEVRLDTGDTVTRSWCRRRRRPRRWPGSARRADRLRGGARLFEQVALADDFVDFLTLPAYETVDWRASDRLTEEVLSTLDARLADRPTRRSLTAYPGGRRRAAAGAHRYVPATPSSPARPPAWGARPPCSTLAARRGPPLGVDRPGWSRRCHRGPRQARREPIEDLRIDLEDGTAPPRRRGGRRRRRRGTRSPGCCARRRARLPGSASRASSRPPGVAGCAPWTSFSPLLRRPAARGLVVTLPKVTSVDQVTAMRRCCDALEQATAACRAAALRDPGGDPAGRPRARRRRHGRGDGARRRAAGASACTTAPTTTAPPAGSPRRTKHGPSRRRLTPRPSCRWRRPARACGSRRVDQRLPVGRRSRCGGLAAARAAGPPLPGTRLLPGLDLHPGSARHAGTSPPTPSTAPACPPWPVGCADYVDRVEGGVLDEPATAQALARSSSAARLRCPRRDGGRVLDGSAARASRRSRARREVPSTDVDLVVRAPGQTTATGTPSASASPTEGSSPSNPSPPRGRRTVELDRTSSSCPVLDARTST